LAFLTQPYYFSASQETVVVEKGGSKKVKCVNNWEPKSETPSFKWFNQSTIENEKEFKYDDYGKCLK